MWVQHAFIFAQKLVMLVYMSLSIWHCSALNWLFQIIMLSSKRSGQTLFCSKKQDPNILILSPCSAFLPLQNQIEVCSSSQELLLDSCVSSLHGFCSFDTPSMASTSPQSWIICSCETLKVHFTFSDPAVLISSYFSSCKEFFAYSKSWPCSMLFFLKSYLSHSDLHSLQNRFLCMVSG